MPHNWATLLKFSPLKANPHRRLHSRWQNPPKADITDRLDKNPLKQPRPLRKKWDAQLARGPWSGNVDRNPKHDANLNVATVKGSSGPFVCVRLHPASTHKERGKPGEERSRRHLMESTAATDTRPRDLTTIFIDLLDRRWRFTSKGALQRTGGREDSQSRQKTELSSSMVHFKNQSTEATL